MSRTIIALTGSDRAGFLDGLITNDVAKAKDSIIYAALLSPQGKFLADFFVIGQDDRLLIDVATSHAPALAQRLTMYRLRADVQIAECDLGVSCGVTQPPPNGALADPRDPALGWRLYGADDLSEDVDWTALRVQLGVPETGIELTPDSFILEAGFERLNGVDFKKGCFVGQEIVARMKHKTDLRKGIVRVAVQGPAKPGDEITSDGKPAGTLHSVSGDQALAYLRFDRTKGEMQTETAKIQTIDN